MKKLLEILVLSLLWCNVSFAEELTINSLLKDGYFITKDETVKFTDIHRVNKIITLKRGRSDYVICVIEIKRAQIYYTHCTMP